MCSDERGFSADQTPNDDARRSGQAATRAEEISINARKIKTLAPRRGAKEIGADQGQQSLMPLVETEVGGIGMGVLSDGTPYLNQRGLAALCGVQNAHIGTISSQWSEVDQKPRIGAIKSILNKANFVIPDAAHIEVSHAGRTHYCYPAEVCLAILEYYAFDAGPNCQPQARDNFRQLAGSKLRDLIYSQVGYDPTGRSRDKFRHWHDRISLNYQSAPRGFFHVFNEASTIYYELIVAGAEIDQRFVVDISIGLHWSRYWQENGLEADFGSRGLYRHRYPDEYPQAKSNPQESWCYPLEALGAFRLWMQDVYIEGGKFANYLKSKVQRGEIAPSVAQLALDAIVPRQLPQPDGK